jgi:hypothetical protein
MFQLARNNPQDWARQGGNGEPRKDGAADEREEECTLRRYQPADVLPEIAQSHEPEAGRSWTNGVCVPLAHSRYS